MIFRTAIAEIIVRTDKDTKSLDWWLHGTESAYARDGSVPVRNGKKHVGRVEIIRPYWLFAYGRRPRVTLCGTEELFSSGKGRPRWNQIRWRTQAQTISCVQSGLCLIRRELA